MKNVLVISAHPDDETIGAGGTLLRHAAQGYKIHWLIITKSFEPHWSSETIAAKTAEVDAVAEAFGFDQVIWPGLPTTQLDKGGTSPVISAIADCIKKVKPEVVYTVHQHDIHTDHRVVFDATSIVLKSFYMKQLGVRRFLTFECLSSTEAAPAIAARAFIPQVFCDIGDHIDTKVKIMSLYQTESQPDPFPRGPSAIYALARFRGASIGVDYAEAFQLIREIG